MRPEEILAIAGTLGDVLPLEVLPDADRLDLGNSMALRKFKADEVVYHQGDPAAHAYVVVDGLVKVLLLDENGRELLVSLHRRGRVFCGVGLFVKGARGGAAGGVVGAA